MAKYDYTVYMITITSHAQDRINTRLNNMVSASEITSKINAISHKIRNDRKNFVMIKKVQYTEIYDNSVKPDGIARGDCIIAIVENNVITTVCLRKSWSQSVEFNHIIK